MTEKIELLDNGAKATWIEVTWDEDCKLLRLQSLLDWSRKDTIELSLAELQQINRQLRALGVSID